MTEEVDPIDPTDGELASGWQPYVDALPAPEVPWPPSGRIVVVAPHPDDEILPTGATLAAASDAGASITVVAVTDGDASHPHLTDDEIPHLVARRTAESEAAYLAADIYVDRVRLQLPDGDVASHRAALASELPSLLAHTDHVIAPLGDDGHPDHDVVGQVVSDLVDRREQSLHFVPIWSWNWRPVSGDHFPAGFAYSFESELLDRKRAAIACYDSQVNDILPGGRPGLPTSFLAHFDRRVEVFFPG